MKKWVALLLAAVLLFSCLTGCSNDGNGTNSDNDHANGDSSKPGKDNGSDTRTGFGYKVEYADFELDENITYVGTTCVSGETLFFTAGYKTGTATETYTNPDGEEVSYEYDVTETRMFRVDLESLQVQMIPGYEQIQYSEEQQGYSNVEKMYADGEGGLWAIETRSVSIFELPEDFDQETQSRWDYWTGDETSVYVLRFDADGAKTSEYEVNLPEDIYVYDYMLDSSGNLYGTDGSCVYGYGVDGKEILKIESDNYVSLMQVGMDLIYLATYDEEGHRVLTKLDLETKALGEELKLTASTAANAWQFYPGFDNYQFLYEYNGRIYGYVEETQQQELVLDWLDCDINSNYIQSFGFMDDGRVVAWESEYSNGAQRYSLDFLTRVPKSELPEETEITLGCMYVSWDMRTKIVDFNKKNEGVRIVIRDYSEFNTEDDYTAGKTKLTTEILSGKVPDILYTTQLPISQYGGKGLLVDLWTLIDQDPELSRENLMTEVFDAMSPNGELYYVTDTFSIRTAVGNASLVGDEIGWTLEDLLEAKAMLEPDATIFGESDTKMGILETCLYQSLDTFIDWQNMQCSFDSEGFIELLKFADTFPLEYDWEDYDYSNYESEYSRLKTGKQLLLNAYIYGVENYLYYCAMLDNQATFVGFPSTDGNGNVFDVGDGLAISATCEDVDAAWSFVRELLLEDNQNSDYLWEFPTNRNVFEKLIEQTMTPDYVTDAETGEQVEQPLVTYWMDENVQIDIMAMTQQQYEGLMELYDSCKTVRGSNTEIIQIIADEAEVFFNGQKSAEEIARLIQSRVGLYLAEQG